MKRSALERLRYHVSHVAFRAAVSQSSDGHTSDASRFPGLERDAIAKIVDEWGRTTPFGHHQKKAAEQRRRRTEAVAAKSKKFDGLSRAERDALAEQAAAILRRLEAGRRFDASIHLDMDMFFAAVEEHYQPELKHVPFAVGDHRMISTANYIARRYGVRSAMPGALGLRLCPQLVLVPLTFERYRAASEAMHQVVRKYDDSFSSMGLDEVTLNVTSYLKRTSSPSETCTSAQLLQQATELATTIRRDVHHATGLTASCGIGPNSVLAKIVSDYRKPNGQYTLHASTKDEIMAFVANLPLRSAIGIGAASEEMLSAMQLTCCGDLVREAARLLYCLTPRHVEFLLGVGLGVASHAFAGTGRSESAPRERSVSRGHTFASPLSRPGQLEAFADELLQECLTQLQGDDVTHFSTVGVMVKFRSFEVKSHTKRVGLRRNTDGHAARTALHFLLHPYASKFDDIRFVGVRVAVDHKPPPPNSFGTAPDCNAEQHANSVSADEDDADTEVDVCS